MSSTGDARPPLRAFHAAWGASTAGFTAAATRATSSAFRPCPTNRAFGSSPACRGSVSGRGTRSARKSTIAGKAIPAKILRRQTERSTPDCLTASHRARGYGGTHEYVRRYQAHPAPRCAVIVGDALQPDGAQRWRARGSAAAQPMSGRRPLRLRCERVVVGADRREAGSDLAGGGGPAGRARRGRAKGSGAGTLRQDRAQLVRAERPISTPRHARPRRKGSGSAHFAT